MHGEAAVTHEPKSPIEMIEETMEELERNDRLKIKMLLTKGNQAALDGKRHSVSTVASPKVLFGDEWNPS